MLKIVPGDSFASFGPIKLVHIFKALRSNALRPNLIHLYAESSVSTFAAGDYPREKYWTK